MFNENDLDTVLVNLDDETTILFETAALPGEEEVDALSYSFDLVSSQISKLSSTIVSSFKGLGHSKATVEFGVNVALKSGKLTALVVEGSGEANLKITLEWNEKTSV